MSEDDWQSWITRHATLFCLTQESDVHMFRQWRREFAAMKFTAAELHEATDHLAREARGVTRWSQLEIIREFILGRRRLAAARRLVPAPGNEADVGTCEYCGDSGWCGGLPHLSQVTIDGWLPVTDGRPALTTAVICHCLAGRWQIDAWLGRSSEFRLKYPMAMTLTEYSQRNSLWRVQVREMAERIAAQRQADVATKDADRAGGTLKKALAAIVAKAATIQTISRR